MKTVKELVVVIGILLLGLAALLVKWRINESRPISRDEAQEIIRYGFVTPERAYYLRHDPNSSYVSLFFIDKDTGEHFHTSRFVKGEDKGQVLEQVDSLIEEVRGREGEYLFRLALRPTETAFRLLSIELFREQDEHRIVFYDIVGL